MDDPRKRHAPATLRNRAPIEAVLRDLLTAQGTVLEIASGTGEHAVHFAGAFPGIVWQPSDTDASALASIAAWREEASLSNLHAPLHIDAAATPWPGIEPGSLYAVVSLNMIHISPWASCQGLMAGSAQALKPGGFLLLYGPFKQDGRHTAPSNMEFDDHLHALDPRFGVRDIAEVVDEAAKHGLKLERQVEMPANNLSVVFREAA